MLRIDGRSLPDFFVEGIATPLQLPALRFGLAGRDISSLAFSYWLGKEKVIVAGMNVADDFEGQNSEQFLNARNPATSLVSDAASLTAFYNFLVAGGMTFAVQQLISERMIRQCQSLYKNCDRSTRPSCFTRRARWIFHGSTITVK